MSEYSVIVATETTTVTTTHTLEAQPGQVIAELVRHLINVPTTDDELELVAEITSLIFEGVLDGLEDQPFSQEVLLELTEWLTLYTTEEDP